MCLTQDIINSICTYCAIPHLPFVHNLLHIIKSLEFNVVQDIYMCDVIHTLTHILLHKMYLQPFRIAWCVGNLEPAKTHISRYST